VLAVPAHGFSAEAARDAGFVSGKLVRAALSVCRLAALASDLALAFCVHRRKAAALFGFRAVRLQRHFDVSFASFGVTMKRAAKSDSK
jgi:hypothetical protein